jgi:hypothetical protein
MRSLAIAIFIAVFLITNTNSQGGTCSVANCSLCKLNSSVCQQCDTGFTLQNTSICYSNTILNCPGPINFVGCPSCNQGAGLFNYNTTEFPNATNLTSCLPCLIPNCYYCSSNASTCGSCNTGFVFQNSSNMVCIDISTWNCSETANTIGCASCLVNTTNTTNSTNGTNITVITVVAPFLGLQTNYSGTGLQACSLCTDANCNNCTENYLNCTTCTDNYVEYQGLNYTQCYPCNSLNCGSPCASGEGCTSCSSGFFLNLTTIGNDTQVNECSACPTGCDACKGDKTGCTSCQGGYFYVNSTYCQTCTANCISCNSDAQCTTCPNTTILQNLTKNGSWTSKCINGALSMKIGFLILATSILLHFF